jgi:hypothetical protein
MSSRAKSFLVPLAGIEPALLAELDFESSASTNSATGACREQPKGGKGWVAKPAEYSGRTPPVNPLGSLIRNVDTGRLQPLGPATARQNTPKNTPV